MAMSRSLGVVTLAGEPASGKSSVFRAMLSQLNERPVLFKSGLVNGFHFTTKRLTVLGSYDSQLQHPGTDKLSMAVQPDFNALLRRWSADPERAGWVILYEGDRLCNATSLNLIQELQLPWIGFVLYAPPDLLLQRHAARDTQDSTWLAGRLTKVRNLADQFKLTRLKNESALDLLVNAGILLEAAKELQRLMAKEAT